MKPQALFVLGLICLCAAPCPAGQRQTESLFEKNRALLERGEYRAAMLGFMELVIANPDDSRAREHLRLAGERVVKKEREDALARKKRLLASALDSRRLIMTLRAAKEKRSAPWRASLAHAASLAGSIDTVKEAVLAFEQWLEGVPVYSDNKKEFLGGLARIKETFYRTIKGKYPYLVQGRTTVNSRDLASLTFSQESLSESADHYVETNQTQKVLEKADRLRRIERQILEHYGLAEKATELYRRTHYAESMAGFRKVLGFDAFNEEALFFLDQAQKRLGLAAAGEELK
ncbi:MAG: hypothetical protein HY796_06875 [Elusimicrobia bacterium]|nr:hypothetical protein [Elusimicrobiota bacterium]